MANTGINVSLGIDLNDFMRGLKTATNEAKTGLQQIAANPARLTVDGKGALSQIQAVAGAFDAARSAGMKTSSELRSALAGMAASGQKGSAEYKEVALQLRLVEGETRKLESATADVEKEFGAVGASGQGMGQSVGGSIARLAAGAVGITAVATALRSGLSAGMDFETSMADLSAITGLTGDSLKNAGDDARKLAVAYGTDGTQGVETMKLVISALGPEVAQSREGLRGMTDTVLMFAKSAGLDAASATDALTISLSQFGFENLSAADKAAKMADIANVLAAAAKEGSVEIPELTQGIRAVGGVAAGAKMTVEQTAAALEMLGPAGLKGAEGGNALRNMILNLSAGTKVGNDALKSMGLSFNDVNPERNGFTQSMETLRAGMEKVQDPVKRASIVAALFGKENALAAGRLMDTAGSLDAFTAKITGTSAAQDMAATKMQTTAELWNSLKAKITDAAIGAFEESKPAIQDFVATLDKSLAPAMKSIPAMITGAISIFKTLIPILSAVTKFAGEHAVVITAAAAGYKALSPTIKATAPFLEAFRHGIDGGAKGIKGLSAALSANPFGLIMTGLSIALPLIMTFADSLGHSTEKALHAAEEEVKYGQSLIDSNKSRQDAIRSNDALASRYIELANKANRSAAEEAEIKGLHTQMQAAYPGVIKSTDSYSQSVRGIAAAASMSRVELYKLQGQLNDLQRDQIKAQAEVAKYAKQQATEVVTESLKDALGPSFWDQLTSSTEGMIEKGQQIKRDMRLVSEAMQRASGMLAVDNIRNQVGQAVSALLRLKEAGKLTAEQFNKLMSDIDKAKAEYVKYALLKETGPAAQSAPKAVLPPPTEDAAADDGEAAKAASERQKLLAEIAEQIRKQQSERTVKGIADARQQELKALDETNAAEIRSTKTRYAKLGDTNTELQQLLTLTEENNLAARNAKIADLVGKGMAAQIAAEKSGLDALASLYGEQSAEIIGDSVEAQENRYSLQRQAQDAQLQSLRVSLLAESGEYKQRFAEIDQQYLEARLSPEQYRLAVETAMIEAAAALEDPKISAALAKFKTANIEAVKGIDTAWQKIFIDQLPALKGSLDDQKAALEEWFQFYLEKYQGNAAAQEALLQVWSRRTNDILTESKGAAKSEAGAVIDGFAVQKAAMNSFYTAKSAARDADLKDAARNAELEIAIARRQAKEGFISYSEYADKVAAIKFPEDAATDALQTAVDALNNASAAAFGEVGKAGATAFVAAFQGKDKDGNDVSSELAKQLANLDFSGFSDAADKAKNEGGKFLQGAISQFVGITAEAGLKGENMAKAAAKTTIQIAFQTLQALVPIWSAQILGGSLASPESILTGGALGIVKWAALTALMEAAVVGVEALAMSALGFMQGGYTGDGPADEPAGIVHKGELVLTKEQVAELQRVLPGIKGRGGAAVVMRAAQAAGVAQVGPVSAAGYTDHLRDRLGNPSPERITKALRADVSPQTASRLQGGTSAAAYAADQSSRRQNSEPTATRFDHRFAVEVELDTKLRGDDILLQEKRTRRKALDRR